MVMVLQITASRHEGGKLLNHALRDIRARGRRAIFLKIDERRTARGTELRTAAVEFRLRRTAIQFRGARFALRRAAELLRTWRRGGRFEFRLRGVTEKLGSTRVRHLSLRTARRGGSGRHMAEVVVYQHRWERDMDKDVHRQIHRHLLCPRNMLRIQEYQQMRWERYSPVPRGST